MKKFLLILLALTMCISMCACGGDNDPIDETTYIDDGSIELTLENYKQFLRTSFIASVDGDSYQGYASNGLPLTWKDGVTYSMRVEGLSTNFNYMDVVVVAKITINANVVPFWGDGAWQSFSIDSDLEVTTDIAGNGNNRMFEKAGKTDYGASLLVDYSSLEYDYEIISVKGKVVPAR